MSNSYEHPLFGKVIHAYTRQQMIDDGTLIDVSKVAREAGFRFPVAITHAAWSSYVVPSINDAARWGQDTEGRLWDTLYMLLVEIKRGNNGQVVMYSVYYRLNGRLELKRLKAIAGPGDHGEPVITIMLPDENND